MTPHILIIDDISKGLFMLYLEKAPLLK